MGRMPARSPVLNKPLIKARMLLLQVFPVHPSPFPNGMLISFLSRQVRIVHPVFAQGIGSAKFFKQRFHCVCFHHSGLTNPARRCLFGFLADPVLWIPAFEQKACFSATDQPYITFRVRILKGLRVSGAVTSTSSSSSSSILQSLSPFTAWEKVSLARL